MLTPVGLLGLLLGAAFAVLRRWESLARRYEQERHEAALEPDPIKLVRWWRRLLGR